MRSAGAVMDNVLTGEAAIRSPSAGRLDGSGEMARLVQSLDWASTPLGAPAAWQQSLRSALSICLGSRFPIVIYWGPDLVVLYNDAYAEILGKKHPSALGRPCREVWSEIWDVIGPMLDRVLTLGDATWSEDQLLILERRGYPEECYFSFSFSPVRGANGAVDGIFTAVIENTIRVLGERRLRTLRDLGASLAGATSAEEACSVAADVLAQNRADVPFALFYLTDPQTRRGNLVATTEGENGVAAAPASFELDRLENAGVWPLASVCRSGAMAGVGSPSSVLVLPLVAAGETNCAGIVVVGVSSHRELDQEYKGFFELISRRLAAAIAEASAYEAERQRAEALAEIDRAKTAFFSNVSHEFRTPLTLMLGPLEESLRNPSLDQSERENISTAHSNALRLLKLVNSLLDFARVEAGRAQANYQPTDLAAFTVELASSFKSLCRRAGLELAIDCPPLSQAVYVDRDMWEKIVLNLLSNAFKFTFEGRIFLALREDGGTAALTVSDTGTGIPEAELPRLFERFHRVEGVIGRTHEGSGIGLALVKEIVRLHGGTVEVQSTEGRGSSFTVRIPFGTAHLPRASMGGPRAPASTATRSEAFVAEAARWISSKPNAHWEHEVDSVEASPASADRPRVLVADDNSDMRSYLRRLLSPYYEIEATENGEAALAAARARRPDLILADVMMPRLDGFGLLACLREDEVFRDLPIILLSARAGEEARVEGLAAGADDYLTKPFSARELLARIESNIKLAGVRRQSTAEVQARLREFEALVSATSDVVYRVNADWTEMRYLLGREFIASTEKPSRSWLEAYIDPADQHIVMHAVNEAIKSKGVFELEHRVRRVDGTLGWTFSRAIPLLDDHGEIVEWLGTASDVTERRRAQEQQQLLVRELSHRVKNLFAIAGGMVALSARSAKTPEDMARAVRNRLDALARAHELAIPALTAAGDARTRGTTLDTLVRAICSPYLDGKAAEGIVAEGPPAQLAGQAVTSFALVLNELATNAVKYGALSAPTGRIEVTWSLDNSTLSVIWTERDGPTVDGRPNGHGFGTLLARRSIEGQLGGAIEYDWLREGVRVRLSVPAERLSG